MAIKKSIQLLKPHVNNCSIQELQKYLFYICSSSNVQQRLLWLKFKFTLVNYDSRVVIWGIFQSGTTLES